MLRAEDMMECLGFCAKNRPKRHHPQFPLASACLIHNTDTGRTHSIAIKSCFGGWRPLSKQRQNDRIGWQKQCTSIGLALYDEEEGIIVGSMTASRSSTGHPPLSAATSATYFCCIPNSGFFFVFGVSEEIVVGCACGFLLWAMGKAIEH